MTNLDWNNEERRKFERQKHKKEKDESKQEYIELDMPFILPHEFLFLMCNSLNRLSNINRLH